ncbi:hypothetical protein GCM10008960_31930 [Deinococcus sedimenti]|uniref:Uncharacterized protein n=1 Tax=Deinococcus sedimenti TaxID=1867090 RepID=A0ABQ2S7I6_9DEIO|nr:hypothetical protein GCM10008960_31930 [Deinococcus sedimenti]
MTTMHILAELRAAAPTCKNHVRRELTQGLADGTITRVAGVYYVVTAQINAARTQHLHLLAEDLKRHGPSVRLPIIKRLGISAAFLAWLIEQPQSIVTISLHGKRTLILSAIQPEQPAPDATEQDLQRILDYVKNLNARRDSITRMVTELKLARSTILQAAEQLVERGCAALRSGSLLVLEYLRDLPAPQPATAPIAEPLVAATRRAPVRPAPRTPVHRPHPRGPRAPQGHPPRATRRTGPPVRATGRPAPPTRGTPLEVTYERFTHPKSNPRAGPPSPTSRRTTGRGAANRGADHRRTAGGTRVHTTAPATRSSPAHGTAARSGPDGRASPSKAVIPSVRRHLHHPVRGHPHLRPCTQGRAPGRHDR